MKFGVVVFPGSNCDDDMVHVLGDVLGQDVVKLWHKNTDLPDGLDCVVLPGGFSYGDYVRAGAIAQFSPIMKAVKAFAASRGLCIWCVQRFSNSLRSASFAGHLAAQCQPEVHLRQRVDKTGDPQLGRHGGAGPEPGT